MANVLSFGFFAALFCMTFGLIAWFCKFVNEGPLPLPARCVLLPVGLLALWLVAFSLAIVLGVFLFVCGVEFFKALDAA